MAVTFVAAVGTAPQPCTLYLAPACSRSASAGWRGPWGSWAGAAEWWSGPWWCRRAAARGQSSGCPSEGLQRQSKATSNLTGPTTETKRRPSCQGKIKHTSIWTATKWAPSFEGKWPFISYCWEERERKRLGQTAFAWTSPDSLETPIPTCTRKGEAGLRICRVYLVWNQAKGLFSSFHLQYELKAGKCKFRQSASTSNHSTPVTSWKHRTSVLFHRCCFCELKSKDRAWEKRATCLGTRPERRCSRSRPARSWPLSPPPSRRGV